MRAENLYSEHWPLAYEAYEQGWLPSQDGSDYIAADGLFSILRNHGVRFYDVTFAMPPISVTGYGEAPSDFLRLPAGAPTLA